MTRTVPWPCWRVPPAPVAPGVELGARCRRTARAVAAGLASSAILLAGGSPLTVAVAAGTLALMQSAPRIGELHGGTVTATSIQSGTSFNLTLPLVAREV